MNHNSGSQQGSERKFQKLSNRTHTKRSLPGIGFTSTPYLSADPCTSIKRKGIGLGYFKIAIFFLVNASIARRKYSTDQLQGNVLRCVQISEEFNAKTVQRFVARGHALLPKHGHDLSETRADVTLQLSFTVDINTENVWHVSKTSVPRSVWYLNLRSIRHMIQRVQSKSHPPKCHSLEKS